MLAEMQYLVDSDPRMNDLNMRMAFLQGDYEFQSNYQNFVDVKPIKFEDFMKKWWSVPSDDE